MLASLVFALYNVGGRRPFRILGPFEAAGPSLLAVVLIGAANLIWEPSDPALDVVSLVLAAFAFLYFVAVIATAPEKP